MQRCCCCCVLQLTPAGDRLQCNLHSSRASAHRKALLEGRIHSLNLLQNEGLLHSEHGALHAVVDANSEIQIANLLPEHVHTFIDLQLKRGSQQQGFSTSCAA